MNKIMQTQKIIDRYEEEKEMNDEISRLKSDYEEEIALLNYDIEKRNDLLKKALTSNLWEVRGTLREEIENLLNPPWYNSIPKQGVLCWVGNDSCYLKDIDIRLIIKKFEKSFISSNGIHWKYATSLTNDEIEAFKR